MCESFRVPGFRVTKYDPRERDEWGRFMREDWTGFGDVGKEFAGVVLTLAAYAEVEGRYLGAIAEFMRLAGVDSVEVQGLEHRGVDRQLDAAAALVAEGQRLDRAQALEVAQLNLREALWCRLVGAGGFYVHFGWDYYMYIGGDALPAAPPEIAGMFVEAFASPYHE